MSLLAQALVLVLLPAAALASSQYRLALEEDRPFPPHNYHMQTAPASPWSLPSTPLSNFTRMSQCE